MESFNTSDTFALDGIGTAIHYFDQILKADPKHVNALFGKGASLVGLGRYYEALHFLNAALKKRPNDTAALDNLCLTLFGLGDHVGALKSFDTLKINPHNTFALYNKGWALQEMGNWTGAIIYYDKDLAIKYDGDAVYNRDMAQAALKYRQYSHYTSGETRVCLSLRVLSVDAKSRLIPTLHTIDMSFRFVPVRPVTIKDFNFFKAL